MTHNRKGMGTIDKDNYNHCATSKAATYSHGVKYDRTWLKCYAI